LLLAVENVEAFAVAVKRPKANSLKADFLVTEPVGVVATTEHWSRLTWACRRSRQKWGRAIG
jgi:hypothetical protein